MYSNADSLYMSFHLFQSFISQKCVKSVLWVKITTSTWQDLYCTKQRW